MATHLSRIARDETREIAAHGFKPPEKGSGAPGLERLRRSSLPDILNHYGRKKAMIRRVEIYRYRCLRRVEPELGNFHILVGPNGSGKSSFLDAIHLLGDLLQDGLSPSIQARSPNPLNLVWMEQGKRFEIAIELEIPEDRRNHIKNGIERARYRVAIGLDADGALAILAENLWLTPGPEGPRWMQKEVFPSPIDTGPLIPHEGKHFPKGWRPIVTKAESGKDYFHAENTQWKVPFTLGPQRLALSNLPEDEERFPVATWTKMLLKEGIHYLSLKGEAMRRPSPPGSPVGFQPDGSNLPRVIETLQEKNPARFESWLEHVRTAIPEIRGIEVIEREEDRHKYLRILYATGLRAPSWIVSDGTLRLLALTLLAYIEEPGRIYLIEEPENGIHPQAIETVFQSIKSAYRGQILCATHSPVMLSLADPEQVLCFAKDSEGATDIIRGSEHPVLRDWRREVDLGTLFASGILG
jgi:predicted ATPase